MRLLLVRHGESTANRDRRVLGRSLNVALTDRGRRQALDAAQLVASLSQGSAKVYCSDSVRARQTAEVIGRLLGVSVEATELLREQYLGDLEGRAVSELRALPTPEGLHVTEVGWGGGESIEQVAVRMRRLLAWLAVREPSPETVVLVGHGDALCVLLAVLAGRTHRDVDFGTDSLELGGVRLVEWSPQESRAGGGAGQRT